MFKASNDFLVGRKPVPTPAGIETIHQRFDLSLAASDLTLNNIGNIGILPAGCIPVGLVVDSDKLDNGTTLDFSIGVSNASVVDNVQGDTPTDISVLSKDGGAAWGTGVVVSRAGGQVAVFSKALARVQPVDYDRYVVLKATAAAATAAPGEIGVTLAYRAA